MPLHPPAHAIDAPATLAPPAAARGLPWPWFDLAFAILVLIALETAVFTSNDLTGARALNALAVAAMAVATAWRRRFPLGFIIAVEAIAAIMTLALTPVRDLPIVAAYLLLVPTYSVAAWASRRRAVVALLVILGLAVADQVTSRRGSLADLLGAVSLSCAAWGLGLAVRARRQRNTALGRNVARIVAEGEGRTRLAVAAERSRIARELHQSLAGSVSAMIVQAEVARMQLNCDPVSADSAMQAIEDTGRHALSEMRRILGALRHGEDAAELRPLPGVDQIYALIRRERDAGNPVELSVAGEPGMLPTTVELGAYRVVEEALLNAREHEAASVAVSLSFHDDYLELTVGATPAGVTGWPTETMRDRIALCGGALEPSEARRGGSGFTAHLPHTSEGAFL